MHFFYSNTDCEASDSGILEEFDFINDFGFEIYKDIRQKPLSLHYNEGIEICYVTKGRYEWVVGDKSYLLFPGDGFVTCPWQKHGSPKEVVDLGEIYWLVIKPGLFSENGEFNLGDWSRLKQPENRLICNVLSENTNHTLVKAQVLKTLFVELHKELMQKDFGYYQRICNLVEELLICIVRQIQNRENKISKDRQWFLTFESVLKSDISKKWTLREIAATNNVGITTLTKLVKEYTGYTPANYLIFLRLEKAKEILTKTNISLTNIALECGFYSSQHFSSTFSKWVGITPNNFRRNFKRDKL
ncbi:MAG: AraC family transcriptional regulator [Bacteroidetes bacterium]|nr:AraC family transcriptional regulator [Bacteroidota bacterium]